MRFGWIRRTLITATVVALALMTRATVALASAYPGGGENPPKVKGEQFFRGGTERPADTGLNILFLILLALIALLIGLILRSLKQRRAVGDVD